MLHPPLVRNSGRTQKCFFSPAKQLCSFLNVQNGLFKFLSISVLLYGISSFYPDQSQCEIVSFLEKFCGGTSFFVDNYFNEEKNFIHKEERKSHENVRAKETSSGKNTFFFVTAQKKESYYKKLGIKKTATEKEIKRAWRKVSLELHPDKNPNNPDAAEKFAEASVAYDVLSNPEKRKMYDARGEEGVKQMEQQEAQGGGVRSDTLTVEPAISGQGNLHPGFHQRCSGYPRLLPALLQQG